MTSENFHRNIPSERYLAGFEAHSVNPLKTWIAMPAQMMGISLFSEVYGMVWNKPSIRRQMMKMRPTTIAFPNACSVSANGQPQDSLTHTAYCVFVSHSSTVQPSLDRSFVK